MPLPRTVLLTMSLAVVIVGFPIVAFGLPRPSMQGVWPLDGPTLVRGFHPPATPWTAGHRGVDLATRPGAPVRAAADGTVRFAGQIAGRGVVVVDHGSVRTTYEPVIAEVRVGSGVVAGQSIGRIGQGSHCAVPCLHWGLRRGADYLNPLQLVSAGDDRGGVRLVGAEQREVAKRAAAARAASVETHLTGRASALEAAHSGVRHGFLQPVTGGITSRFGKRFHPVLRIWKLHDGIDYGAACGSPIRAPQAGRVSAAYGNAGYGNRLMIDHGVIDGHHVVTGFNHATRYVVNVGQRVGPGQLIGYVGSTGFSTGCHLHLMLWLDGGLRNPSTYF